MTLTIDNLDGKGPIDYTAAISAGQPLRIARVLNQPSVCDGMLEVGSTPVPTRRARIIVTAANGTVLFTGYLAIEPTGVYAGVASTGPVYRYAFSALSDEWLLDKQTPTLLALSLASSAGAALTTLAQRSGPGLLTTTGVTNARAVGVFEASQTVAWSKNAGALAAATYSAYRAISGALTLQSAATVTHSLDFDTGGDNGGGTLTVAALKTSSVKELANDVTLSGELEPAAYIAETFAGDGTTTVFQLTEIPFRPTASLRDLIADDFNESVIDTQIWEITDPGAYLSLSAKGLTMSGGNGYDGQTTLTALDFVEIGGSLLIEANNVVITGASVGVVCGLYNGSVSTANCLAGYGVTQSAGVPSITPLVNGAAVGTAFTLQPGHTYTLRIRLNCPEVQRIAQTYYAMVDGVVESFGGGASTAPLIAVFDLVDLGAASNTPATILYDGATAAPIASTPGSCIFAAVNCVQIFGSIGAVTLTQTGSAWITSTLPSGVKETRLIGIAGEGADLKLSATGLVTFFAGRTPVAGEFVTVTYRNHQRAVTRLEDAASIAVEAASAASGDIPGTARWLGKVLKPPARTSADCESAALAILSFSTSRAAALSGTCEAVNLQQAQADVWPGDALALTENGASTSVIVRRVEIESASSFPEALTYKIEFANDWAEGLGLTLSETIAADALLPLTATASTSIAAGTTLQNLQQLQLLIATTTALQIDAGLAPPTGGGFEVRRRDNNFGPTIPQDLVLRSPVRSFSIPREAQVEQYYVRMYDASTPPLYSRFSSAVFINLPIS